MVEFLPERLDRLKKKTTQFSLEDFYNSTTFLKKIQISGRQPKFIDSIQRSDEFKDRLKQAERFCEDGVTKIPSG